MRSRTFAACVSRQRSISTRWSATQKQWARSPCPACAAISADPSARRRRRCSAPHGLVGAGARSASMRRSDSPRATAVQSRQWLSRMRSTASAAWRKCSVTTSSRIVVPFSPVMIRGPFTGCDQWRAPGRSGAATSPPLSTLRVDCQPYTFQHGRWSRSFYSIGLISGGDGAIDAGGAPPWAPRRGPAAGASAAFGDGPICCQPAPTIGRGQVTPCRGSALRRLTLLLSTLPLAGPCDRGNPCRRSGRGARSSRITWAIEPGHHGIQW